MFKGTPQKISSLSPSEEDVELIRRIRYARFHQKHYQTPSDTKLPLDYARREVIHISVPGII